MCSLHGNAHAWLLTEALLATVILSVRTTTTHSMQALRSFTQTPAAHGPQLRRQACCTLPLLGAQTAFSQPGELASRALNSLWLTGKAVYISLAMPCSSDKTKGGCASWGNVRVFCPSLCMCRLDGSIEEGSILLDQVQQHNLHLATLERYEFRCPNMPFPTACPLRAMHWQLRDRVLFSDTDDHSPVQPVRAPCG